MRSLKDIEPVLKIIQRIYKIIEDYSYSTPTTGVRFRDWADEILKKIEASRPRPATPEPVPPPP